MFSCLLLLNSVSCLLLNSVARNKKNYTYNIIFIIFAYTKSVHITKWVNYLKWITQTAEKVLTGDVNSYTGCSVYIQVYWHVLTICSYS